MHQHRTALAVTLFVAALGVRLQAASPVGAAAQRVSSAEAAASSLETLARASEHGGPSASDAPDASIAATSSTATTASAAPSTSSERRGPAPEADLADGSDALIGGGPATSAGGSVATTGSRSTRTTASAAPTAAPTTTAPVTAAPIGSTSPASAPVGSLTPSVAPSAAEAQVLALINTERAGAGLPALRLTAGATSVARAWSAHMAAHTLDHNPKLVGDLAQTGVGDWRWVAENVGQGHSVDQVHAMFMGSPMHRANILGPQFSQVGIGVATSGDQVFVTLDFLGW